MEETKRQLNEEEYIKYIERWKLENKELIDSGKCRKVFLECLPRWENNINHGGINWKNSIDYNVYFIYENINGYVNIIDYYINKQKLQIGYKDNIIELVTSMFINCNLGKLLKKITSEFKVEIGTRFQDDKRDITIIDRKYRQEEQTDKLGRKSVTNRKWYKYKCNKCGFNSGWLPENNLKKGIGCSCCSGHTVVEGINDIPTTASWMVKYFQGGYDEAKLYTKMGGGNPNNKEGKIYPICPDCGRMRNKKIQISSIYSQHSIGCNCGDGISYPEKLIFAILEQLNLDFQTQLSKTNFKWIDKYRYDFYFEYNNDRYICEVNGEQHYSNHNNFKMSLEETQENDKLKKELALANGIKEKNYMVINCRESELEFIKKNILSSRLNEIFNLNVIDWLKAEKFALSSRVKEVCRLYNENNNIVTISHLTKINTGTIMRYLKLGNKFNWCNYINQSELKNKKKDSVLQLWNEGIRSSVEISKILHLQRCLVGIYLKELSMDNLCDYKNTREKEIIIINTGIICDSADDISNELEKEFKIKLSSNGIRRVCRGERQQYKGFSFKFTSDLTEEQIKEIQENVKLNNIK